MDVAAAKELLENAITASRKLGKNADKIPVWEKMLTKMPDYAIAENGIIKEWLTPKLGNNDAHRHSSQLYPLYDGLPDEIANSPELRSAFIKSVEDKLERYWKDNQRGFMSFGIVQLGQVSASLGHGDIVHHCLQHLVNGFWLNNLASMHNRRSLFNMDISGGQPSVIIKALADSVPGKIRLLPALPKRMGQGHHRRRALPRRDRLNRLHWDGNKVEVEMTSAKAQEITLVLPARDRRHQSRRCHRRRWRERQRTQAHPASRPKGLTGDHPARPVISSSGYCRCGLASTAMIDSCSLVFLVKAINSSMPSTRQTLASTSTHHSATLIFTPGMAVSRVRLASRLTTYG